MKIIDLNNNIYQKHETAVALGNFDGIHIGHKYLIKDMVSKSKKYNLESSVLLFRNHTKLKIEPNKSNMNILTSNNQKIGILNDLGVKTVYIMDFDETIMKLQEKDFVQKIIIDKLNSKLVTIGFDYKFGYKALGDSKTLKDLGKSKEFLVNIVKPIYLGKEVVSSTLIRNLIKEGQINRANRFLGRAYTMVGKVIEGENRGRKLGFPTANIKLNYNYVIPLAGVYKTITEIKDEKYLGLTSVGYNPTFNGEELKIENHILDYKDNIYNEIINIQFVDFIREEKRFDSSNSLINQIQKDIHYIKKDKYNTF